MSLTIYIQKTKEEDSEVLFRQNITHNLNYMAEAAGLYEAMWRPYRLHKDYKYTFSVEEEYEFENSVEIIASSLLPVLMNGYRELLMNPDEYKKYNPENLWGDYDGLVRVVSDYIVAINEYPNGYVFVSR